MPDALIYDHVRTPRGRGRPDGSLHEVSSVELAAQVLRALARRTSLDTARLDDVILGCAQPVGEQGGNIARAALLRAGYAQSVEGTLMPFDKALRLESKHFAKLLCGSVARNLIRTPFLNKAEAGKLARRPRLGGRLFHLVRRARARCARRGAARSR